MKRRIDEIPVSDRLEEAVATGLNRAKFIHRKRIAKRSLAIAASAAIAATGFLTWGFSNPVLASQIPFIGHIFAQNEENISFPGNYSDKVEVLDTETISESTEETALAYTVSDEGYTFTANEVYCDGSSIYLGMTVKADKGFGHIADTPADRYGEGDAVTNNIDLIVAGIKIYADEEIELFLPNSVIEGTQTSDDTLEGILKINLGTNILPNARTLLADLEISGIWYSAPDSPDMVPGISYLCGDWTIPSIPFTIDTENVKTLEINASNEEGFGIGGMIITPYEIKIQYILPPLYSSKEDILAAKREFLGEEGEGMTDEEVDETTDISLSGNYGMSLFDANGNALEFQEEDVSENGCEFWATYSVENADISTLYFYIGEGDHETIKETNQSAMEARALYKYTIDTTVAH